MVRQEFPWCHVVANPANLGFAGGNNRGIEYALARGADWVLLLNNDTIVAPDFLDRLAEAAAAHPDFGIIGPVINYMDEPDAVMTDGCVFNTPDFHGFFKRKPVPITRSNPPSITEVDVVNGCCMMIAAPVFARIGLIDERFFIYHEEMDFCLRARRAGVRSGVIGDQLVWHKGTSSFKKTGKRLPRYYDARNLVLLLWKHSGARHHGRTIVGSIVMYVRYIYYRYCIEREDGHLDSADAVIEGFWDALVGRYGKFVPQRRFAVPAIRLCFEAGRHRPRLLGHER
jgi:GT2 family glycosyltransferase